MAEQQNGVSEPQPEAQHRSCNVNPAIRLVQRMQNFRVDTGGEVSLRELLAIAVEDLAQEDRDHQVNETAARVSPFGQTEGTVSKCQCTALLDDVDGFLQDFEQQCELIRLPPDDWVLVLDGRLRG
ncbi:Hypothetical predicted protein [Pelobates cultripes]|uniref:Uncharacterized protein n=1 Tax=Pelobates cultripes TaxID=61616 RepID=A0AAD1SDK3_PELCU|nr:Hypothetical predicted protein [Pelobates cultripes]